MRQQAIADSIGVSQSAISRELTRSSGKRGYRYAQAQRQNSDIVAIDADAAGEEFLIVSRGGNYVIWATRAADGSLNIGAPNNVVRIQTGNIPSGVVMSSDGTPGVY